MKILDGRKLSQEILEELTAKIAKYNQQAIPPKLAMIIVGSNPASLSYVKQKQISAKKVGLQTQVFHLAEDVTHLEIIQVIEKLNADTSIHGILLQLPLPDTQHTQEVIDAISPQKDVDGFQPFNIGHVFTDRCFEELAPCTPKGVILLLEHYNIPIQGKHAVIVGHSNIVGKPLAVMLLNRNATITVCHVHTPDLQSLTKTADILISAVGKPNLITKDMVKKGACVVDVGFFKDANGIQGDVDFANVQQVADYISPVPGGAGPMTVACLVTNTIIAYEKQMADLVQ